MSNPFLVDLEDSSYTPYDSGVNTPYSGRATPKRRNSTNPFEVLSPDSDEPPIFVDQTSGGELNNKTNNDELSSGNVASAIADMTAEFYQSIKKFDFDTTINDDVFDDSKSKAAPSESESTTKIAYDEDVCNAKFDEKPVKTVTTITYDNNGCVFDPFETIHDDDALSSKRSSIEGSSQVVTKECVTSNVNSSVKAKEMFHSSMASIEMLAAVQSSGDHTTIDDGPTIANLSGDDGRGADFSPLTPTTPMSNYENSFLAAPHGIDAYSSEPSDMSDVSPTTAAAAADGRSAFVLNAGMDQEETSQCRTMDGTEILKQKNLDSHSDDKTSSDFYDNSQRKSSIPATTQITLEHPQLAAITTGSVEIFDIGNPNVNAEGIVNDAFEEVDSKDEPECIVKEPSEPELFESESFVGDKLERTTSVEVTEVESNYIQPNDLRELVQPEDEENTEAAVIVEEASDQSNEKAIINDTVEAQTNTSSQIVEENDVEPAILNNDPFDTSAFDSEAFDAFESRFEATDKQAQQADGPTADPFASPYKTATKIGDNEKTGFDSFEPFMPKPPENTPFKAKPKKKDSFEDSSFDDDDEEEEENLRIVIRAKKRDTSQTNANMIAPLLPPPPKSPRHKPKSVEESEVAEEDMILIGYKTKLGKKNKKSFLDEEFDRFFSDADARTGDSECATTGRIEEETEWPTAFGQAASKRTAGGSDSPASPQTPLYDEDTSQPLEEFPARYIGDGWEMMLRHPAKKKLTANRYWKKVFVRFVPQTCLLQLFNKKEDTQPFQELPLQASYSLSEISAQQFDQYGKIFTIKVQYIFYRERVGVRPGQIAKVMQGQIQSMGDFARLGMPVEHAPQVSELLKLGTLDYNDLKELSQVVEEAMFRMNVHRDRALTYRTEEIQCVVQDEIYVEQSKLGLVEKQLARVRIFFLAFLNGIPAIDVGVNDLRRQGKEVVGRHDILPVVTEEWIRVEAAEFHSCVQSDVFDQTQVVKLIPPDACHFELMRFRIRPPKNRELPLQVSANMNITPTKMELKCDILVPGCISRKHGQIPCEEISLRFHIPECWIYFFRVEKHFRMGAVHSTNRRSGKLKGFERILGTTANPEPQLIEVTAGLAKYEHAYHSIVWRIPRLPKDGQGAYTQQFMVVRLPLSSFDRIPESFYDYVHVEFHMPSTTVSHTTLRSISVNSENPPEKFVRYIAKYEYKIGLNITYDDTKPESDYSTAANLNNGSVKNVEMERNSSEDEGVAGDAD